MTITTAIHGATVLTMSGAGRLRDATVTVSGGVIEGVYAGDDVPPHVRAWLGDPASHVIDGTAKFVIPGLINLHEHLDMHNVRGSMHDRVSAPGVRLQPRSIRNALLAMAGGVTTLRDLGSKDSTNLITRDVINQGQFAGPRIYACGQMISATGGHGQPLCAEADGVDGLRRMTRLQVKNGADVIKVCASGGVVAMRHEDPWAQQLDDEELAAVVREAHRFGLRVASHAQPPAAVKASVLAGVDTVEHAAFLDEECADLLAERQVYLVPTIDDSYAVAFDGDRHGRPAWMRENAKNSIESRTASLERAVKAGVVLGCGTDVVGRMGREMAHLAAAGLPAVSALAAATSTAAEILGNRDIGVIEAGKAADLVVLSADPLADLTACDDAVDLVVRAGRVLRPQSLIEACAGGDIV